MKDSVSLFYMLSFLCAVFGLYLALQYISKYRLAAANIEHEEAGAYIIHAVLYSACVIRSLRSPTRSLQHRIRLHPHHHPRGPALLL